MGVVVGEKPRSAEGGDTGQLLAPVLQALQTLREAVVVHRVDRGNPPHLNPGDGDRGKVVGRQGVGHGSGQGLVGAAPQVVTDRARDLCAHARCGPRGRPRYPGSWPAR